jgi:hypothetical protein
MNKLFKSVLFGLLFWAAFSFATVDASAQGCVMCRAQVGENKDQDEAKKVGSSLNTGILYLVSIPYLLVATVGFIWYKQSRKKQSDAQ